MKDDEEDVSAGAGLLTVQCTAVCCSAVQCIKWKAAAALTVAVTVTRKGRQ